MVQISFATLKCFTHFLEWIFCNVKKVRVYLSQALLKTVPFSLSPLYKCTDCPSTCARCKPDSGQCSACSPDKVLQNGQCVQRCHPGWFSVGRSGLCQGWYFYYSFLTTGTVADSSKLAIIRPPLKAGLDENNHNFKPVSNLKLYI